MKGLEMIVGYARVSTDEQKLDLQLQALKRAGCDKVFYDIGISGAKMVRPELDAAIHAAQNGGTLVVWRLDRLGRSLSGLVDLIDSFKMDGIELRSLTEAIDTSSSSGKLFFHIMAALSEFERTLISERTKAGLKASREKGVKLGRPRALTRAQVEKAACELAQENSTLETVSDKFEVSKRTLQRYLHLSSQ
jgi:DNA invertase Pin-like site-specific DNA recombinase